MTKEVDQDYEDAYPWDEEYHQWIESQEQAQKPRQPRINILLDGDDYDPFSTINS